MLFKNHYKFIKPSFKDTQNDPAKLRGSYQINYAWEPNYFVAFFFFFEDTVSKLEKQFQVSIHFNSILALHSDRKQGVTAEYPTTLTVLLKNLATQYAVCGKII